MLSCFQVPVDYNWYESARPMTSSYEKKRYSVTVGRRASNSSTSKSSTSTSIPRHSPLASRRCIFIQILCFITRLVHICGVFLSHYKLPPYLVILFAIMLRSYVFLFHVHKVNYLRRWSKLLQAWVCWSSYEFAKT